MERMPIIFQGILPLIFRSCSIRKKQFFMPLRPGHKQTNFLAYFLAGMVLLFSLALTFGLWRTTQAAAMKDLQGEFDFRVRQTVDRIDRRMATYEQALRGTKGLLDSSEEVTHAEFHTYIAALRLQVYYPGIQGIAISRLVRPEEKDRHIAEIRAQGIADYAIRPAGEREFYTSISHIEPLTGINPRALGYDMFTEPVRRAAMERARDTDKAALSGKVTLIQEDVEKPQAGFVMYVPMYQKGLPTETLAQRREAITGWIGGPFRMDDLMVGLNRERASDLAIKIYDGDVISQESMLFDSGIETSRNPSTHPFFDATRKVSIAGRPWTIQIESGPAFEQRLDTVTHRYIAFAGGAVSLLLSLLVWTLATGRRRAIGLAREMTRELRSSEFRWKYALEGAGDGVWDFDIRSGEVIFSKRWKEMLGYDDNEIENKFSQWERLIHPEDRSDALVALDDYLAGRSPTYAIEYRMRCKDGGWKWILSRGMGVNRADDGAFIRIIGTHSDISARKKAEQLQAERQKLLDEARTALHHSQKLEAVGKLTGGVAHDFNNALQIIGANLELLQDRLQGNSEAYALLASARKGVERGAKLSSQLLAFARRQPLQPRVVNMRRMTQNLHDLLRSVLGESVEIRSNIADDLANAFIDPHQLENVIVNLAVNSRDAMDGKGCLTIQARNETIGHESPDPKSNMPPGEYVLLSIADTGAGMSAEVLEQAFEPFFTTKPQGKGTGLGLSMAYGFVSQSGGHIRIASEIGRGTTVSIYLPRSLEEESKPVSGSKVPTVGGAETILVVEDDPAVQAAAVAMLTELGYRVVKADDGDAALKILQHSKSIDLLFTDVVMPGTVQSPDLAAHAQVLFPNIAILFTSGYTRNVLIQNEHLDPKVNLLGKPYRREQLAARIRTVLNEKKQSVPEAASQPAGSKSSDADDGGKIRVLVVEDNHDMQTLACEMLSMLGYMAHGTATAEDALNMLKNREYDVLLTDIGLPGMDGVALAREVGRTIPNIRIIFASGYDDIVDAPENSGSVMLNKPYTLVQLQSALQKCE